MTHLRSLGCIAVLTFAAAFGCGSDEGSGTDGTGGTDPGGSGGVSSGGAASGGASSGGAASGGASSGGQGSGGDATGGQSSGGGGSGEVDVEDLGQPCSNDGCPRGLTPKVYCGIAGCEQTSFCTCEVPCDEDPEACPEGSVCATVSDGPGTVCVPS